MVIAILGFLASLCLLGASISFAIYYFIRFKPKLGWEFAFSFIFPPLLAYFIISDVQKRKINKLEPVLVFLLFFFLAFLVVIYLWTK
jgi:hypothetical protein